MILHQAQTGALSDRTTESTDLSTEAITDTKETNLSSSKDYERADCDCTGSVRCHTFDLLWERNRTLLD